MKTISICCYMYILSSFHWTIFNLWHALDKNQKRVYEKC